jgi:AcrR family transcriptional regulator
MAGPSPFCFERHICIRSQLQGMILISMRVSMTRMRIASSERRALILEAARKVFAENGYDGAKTQRIAAEAKISEALVYRHYASKLVLYRAVLRQLIREQDANFRMAQLPEPSTAGLIKSLHNYIEISLSDTSGRMHEGLRMMIASLAGEGGYASLVYRRAQRKMQASIQAAFDAARASGDISGRELAPQNLALFHEHIGTMLNMVRALPNSSELYDNSHDRLVRDAVWFCCRGMGISDAAIREHFGD